MNKVDGRDASAKERGVPRGYKQTEVGVIPEDWNVHSLKDGTDPKRPISYGIVQTGPTVLGGVRCLRVVDISHGRVNDANLITTSQEISNAYKRTILREGDLVMPLRGKVGEVALIDAQLSGCNLTRGLALVALRDSWCALYLKQFIASSEAVTIFRPAATAANRQFLAEIFSTPAWFQAVNDRSGGTTHKRIARGALGRMKIKIPDIEEQNALAAIFTDMNVEITELEAKLTKAQQLKQGMMQELLTGRIRLI